MIEFNYTKYYGISGSPAQDTIILPITKLNWQIKGNYRETLSISGVSQRISQKPERIMSVEINPVPVSQFDDLLVFLQSVQADQTVTVTINGVSYGHYEVITKSININRVLKRAGYHKASFSLRNAPSQKVLT